MSDGEDRWWRFGFPAALAVLIVAIPVLVYFGANVLLDSNSGRLISTVTDERAPGWQAAVEPTPTLAALSLDPRGDLASVTVLVLSGEASGAMIQIPGQTVVSDRTGSTDTLVARYRSDGVEGAQGALESILGVSVGEISVIGSDEWTSLVGPVSPLTVSNPDQVSVAEGEGETKVVFAKGSIDLRADQVWQYISTLNADEASLNLMIRQEAFWRGWLSAVGKSTDPQGAVPGEVDSGLGMFVRTLSSGQVDDDILPVSVRADAGSGADLFVPDRDAVDALIARVIPFPAGPEGERPHVEVFDGTGQLDHGVAVAEVLGAAGIQVDKIGNATSFDVETTRIVYFHDDMRDTAQRMRDVLGFGELVRSDEINSAVDVSVVLGADALSDRSDGTSSPTAVVESGSKGSSGGRSGG